MTRNKAQRNYIIGAVIVWVGIFLATALMLDGDDFFSIVLILAPGAFWFIVLAPQLFLRIQAGDRDASSRDLE